MKSVQKKTSNQRVVWLWNWHLQSPSLHRGKLAVSLLQLLGDLREEHRNSQKAFSHYEACARDCHDSRKLVLLCHHLSYFSLNYHAYPDKILNNFFENMNISIFYTLLSPQPETFKGVDQVVRQFICGLFLSQITSLLWLVHAAV